MYVRELIMPVKSRISRRGLLKQGAAAGAALASSASAPFAQGPAVITARTFRAWISRGTGRGRTTLQDVRLRSDLGSTSRRPH